MELVKEVKEVFRKLVPASGMEGPEWEIHVVNAPSVGGIEVYPGGKIILFTGLLPVCKDEAGLATVKCHHMADVIACHSNECVSTAWVFGLARIPLWPWSAF